MQRWQCGAKTFAELRELVSNLPAAVSSAAASDSKGSDCELGRTNKRTRLRGEELLESIERLRIPYGLPIGLVRLPVRVRNWCSDNDWKTLGTLLQNAGSMSRDDLAAVDNIGKKSVSELLQFFEALGWRRLVELRKFLPISVDTGTVALSVALDDLVASFEARDVRILEMRLVERFRLEAISRNFNRTRELIRQIEHRFLGELGDILNWFPDERVELWHVWVRNANLAPVLAENEGGHNNLLLAAAIASIFEGSPEGRLLQDHWGETFRIWGRELFVSERLSCEGIDLIEFARGKGNREWAHRFGMWLEEHYRGEISVVKERAIRTSAKLKRQQKTLL